MRKRIVIAGGQGSRLWPPTLGRPKPLMPVANRPIITHILHWLRRHDFSDVLVTLHYRAGDIRRALGDGHAFGLKISYQVEEEPLGTAGCVKAAEGWIGGEPFLIASGDALTDVDLAALRRQHQASAAWITLGLKRVHDPSDYGVVELDDEQRVVRFQEKPGPGWAFSNLVNTGIYCIEPQVLERIRPGRSVDWSHDVFPRILAERHPLGGHELHGYWRDIGNIREYLQGQHDVLDGAVRAEVLGIRLSPRLWVGMNAHIAPGVVVKGPVLVGPGCRIEPEAVLLPGTVLGAGTVVGRGAFLHGAILGAGCAVGTGAVIHPSILDDEVRIGAWSVVEEGTVLGRGCQLSTGARVGEELRIEPGRVFSVPSGRAPHHDPQHISWS